MWGGGHGQPLSVLGSGYDCSGATSYILHGAGVLGLYAEDSTQLESYAQPGPGRGITVDANSGHAFIDVAGIVMNTAWYAPFSRGARQRAALAAHLDDRRAVRRRPVRPLHATPPPRTLTMPHRLAATCSPSARRRCSPLGMSDPYTAKPPTPSVTSSTPTPTAPSTTTTNPDPAPERGGKLPPARGRRRASWRQRRPANTTVRARALRPPLRQLDRATVAPVQRKLAAISVGQARAEAIQAAASYAKDDTLQHSGVANSGHLVATTPSIATPGQWVLVTSEQTTGKGDYAGLPPTLHVIYAQVTREPSGWIVSEWAPQN